MLGGPIKVSRSMSLRMCARVYFCAHMHECIYACIKHIAQACLCPQCLCLCLSTHVCGCVCVCVYVWCHLFVSGSGHIHVLISVPSGQIQLSCLLKRDNIPNAKLKTTVSISNSAQRSTTNSSGSEKKITFFLLWLGQSVCLIYLLLFSGQGMSKNQHWCFFFF